MVVVIVIVPWLLLLPIHLAGVKVDRQVPGPMVVVAVMLPVVFVTSAAAVVFVLRRHPHVTSPSGTEAVVAVVVLVPVV